jgi:hypothetical protein
MAPQCPAIFTPVIFVMDELSQNSAVDILKTVATFLSSIATATASFASIVLLVTAVGGESVVKLQGNVVNNPLAFVVASLVTSLLLLGSSCFVLSLLGMVSNDES